MASRGEPWGVVGWARRDVALTDANGAVAFALPDVEAPQGWSEQAVATVARRYFLRQPGGREERSLRELLERVLGAIAGWALIFGRVPPGGDAALEPSSPRSC